MKGNIKKILCFTLFCTLAFSVLAQPIRGGSSIIRGRTHTPQQGTYIESPEVEDLDEMFWFMNDVTITYVWAMTDTGTVTFNLNDGSNDILSSDLVADDDGQTSCASGCDVDTINTDYDNITGKTEDVDVDISATASSPTKVSIFIGYTIDD